MMQVCSPVGVVMTADATGPHGVTVGSLASLSVGPALVTLALGRRSTVPERILAVGRFGVNVLGADEADVAMVFSRREVPRLATTPWSSCDGLPWLGDAAGWAVRELWRSESAGDHLLVIGQVTDAESVSQPPLV